MTEHMVTKKRVKKINKKSTFNSILEESMLDEKEKQMKLREPDLLLVITGGSIAYTRPDGVKVIPLATLKP